MKGTVVLTKEFPKLKQNLIFGSYLHHKKDPFQFYMDLHLRYGKTVKFRLVNLNVVSIVDRDDIKHVLQSNFNNYQRSRGHDILELLIGKGLINLEGPRWREQRRHFQKYFSVPSIESNVLDFYDIIQNRFKYWEENFVGLKELNIATECSKLAQLFGAKVLFGFDLSKDLDTFNQKFQECVDHIGARIHRGRLPLAIPTKENKNFKQNKSYIQNLILNRLNEQLKQNDKISGMLSGALDDLMESELESNDYSQLFIDQVMTFMTAASDTTSTVLAWGFYELARNPKIQEEIYQEIKDLNADDFLTPKKCPLLDSFWNETLRMYPSVWGMSRTVENDDILSGHNVKKGQEIFLLPYVVHRYPEYWKNPNEFKFDRFYELAKVDPYTFFPFGGGQRICIGMHMVSFQSRLLFANVIKNYHISSRENYKVVPEPLYIAMKPRDGVNVFLKRRN